jgi:hypothetical protein
MVVKTARWIACFQHGGAPAGIMVAQKSIALETWV